MHTITTMRAVAIAAGAVAAGGALAILLAEPIQSGAWRLDHVLIPAVVAIAITAGHLVSGAARARSWLAAAGFALIFAVGTALTVYSSVGAQKAGTATRAADVAAANEALRDARAAKTRAESALAALQAEAARLAGTRPTSEVKAAMDRAAVHPRAWANSKQCTAARELEEAWVLKACRPILDLRSEMARAIEKADNGRKVAEAEAKVTAAASALHALGAEKVAASKSAPFADAMGVIGFDRAKVEVITSTFEPFAYSLLFELTAIVAFGFGFGCAGRTVRPEARRPAENGSAAPDGAWPEPNGSPAPAPPQARERCPVRAPNGGPRLSKDAALQAVLTDLALGRRFASQDELAARFGRSKSTVSEWLRDWTREGLIPERRAAGRCKVLEGA